MHYYIDGYNLLFRILKVGGDVRKQREEITFDLERKVNLLGLNVTLVFDSHYQEDDNTKSHFNSLEIIFTAAGETADEFILKELKESKNPSEHIVVTSDKKLARLCQLRLGKIETVDEFLSWIGKRYRNKRCQKKLLQNKPVVLKNSDAPKTLPSLQPLIPQKDIQNCFDYYLTIFEKEFLELEKQAPPFKKVDQKPKKPKIKKRQLTKEEAQLSDLQRWQKAFEKNEKEDSDNFVF